MAKDTVNRPAPRAQQAGGLLAVAANLMWVPQAAIIAHVFAYLLEGRAVAPLIMAGLFFAAGAARAVLNASAQRFLSAAADSEIHALRSEILAVETGSLQSAQYGGAGAVAALATEKLEALRPYLLRYYPARLRVMILPPLILLLCAINSWAVAVVLLMAGPLIPVFMALVGWAAKDASARQMVEIGSLNDLLADRLAALPDLRLIGAGPRVIDSFARASDGLRDRTMSVLRIAFLSSTVLELFSALGVAMVAVWVGFALLGELSWGTWGGPLSPFAGMLMLLLAPEFFQPLRDLSAAWHDKSAADAVHDDMEAWRADTRAALAGRGALDAALPFIGLRCRGLAIKRGERCLTLPNLDIQPGDSIALTGPSGSGKTSLLRVLAGLTEPTTGHVMIGDQRLVPDIADAWRATLGWMPQAPHFLGRSLVHNIGFGAKLDPDVLHTARLRPVLATLPRGGMTILGETGAGLSGGEARRVMLARALNRAPALLLVDEPTADLDAETAQDIIDGLLTFVAQGGTLIAATHDPRLMHALDRRITLEAAQ